MNVERAIESSAPRAFGLGLRAQIVLALSAALLAAFSAFSVATFRLTDFARRSDRVSAARTVALVLEVEVDDVADFEAIAPRIVAVGAVAGLELGEERLYGTRKSTSIDVTTRAGALHVFPHDGDTSSRLAPLLVLYGGMAFGTILLLAYVALTYLIVRPLESVTRASERLAAGRQEVAVPVSGAAEIARLAVAFNDMARQLRAERVALETRLRELESTTRALGSTQDSLLRSEKLASVGRLSAGIAHEIGNPLAAILGLVELLRTAELEPSESAEFLRRIQGETERIHEIIRDLLDFARQGEVGPLDAHASCDLREVVEDAVRLIAPQKDLRTIDIERRFDDDVPLVRGSADQLTQLVLNLLLNAADAIPADGAIRIEVRNEPAGSVTLVVADTGPGIAPDVLPHVFEPFVTTKPVGHGTGLGLAVCHTLVTRLGGTIRALNPKEGGARFEVELPIASD